MKYTISAKRNYFDFNIASDLFLKITFTIIWRRLKSCYCSIKDVKTCMSNSSTIPTGEKHL